jgi:hypothetical protein
MGAEDITQADLLAEVAAFVRDYDPRPGPDWFTAYEIWEQDQSKTAYQVYNELKCMVMAGVMERKTPVPRKTYYRMCAGR